LHGSLIGDLKDINKSAKNHAVNRKLQNFVLSLLQDPNEDAAKRSLNVMIELYKRRIWNDDKTINAIWQGVMHTNPKVCAAACKFFLVLDYDYQSDTESEFDSDKEQQLELLRNRKGSQLSKEKKRYLERIIKQKKRAEKRKSTVKVYTDFLPIDMLYDPQNCAETLFSKLKKSNDKYEVKLLMLRLVSRLIGRHNLILL